MNAQDPQPETSKWSIGAKLITASAVGFLLTFGLCSVGTPFEGHGTPAQDFAANVGLITFLLSVVALPVGIITLIYRALTRKRE